MKTLYTIVAHDQKTQRVMNRLWTKIKTGPLKPLRVTASAGAATAIAPDFRGSSLPPHW